MTATMDPPRRPRVTVDYVYVRYRTVLYGIGATILAALVLGYWWWSSGSISAEQRAVQALASAEAAVVQARRSAPEAPSLPSAEDRLGEARRFLQSANYIGAADEARAAEQLARQALTAAPESSVSVRIGRVDGDVRIKRSGQFLWEEAKEQQVLSVGDQIRTGSGSSADLAYFDGTSLKVAEQTLLEILELHRDAKQRKQRVEGRLAWGDVSATTEAHDDIQSVHTLKTDSTSVTSTEASSFSLKHDREQGKSEVVALSGAVQVRTPSEEFSVAENTRLSFDRGKLVERSELLESPRLIAPPDQRTFLGMSDGVELQWAPHAQAAHYHVQVSDRSLFTRLLMDMSHVAKTSVLLPPMVQGTYYWRVAAIDKKGRSGRWSEPRKFRLLPTEFEDKDDTIPPPLRVTEIMVIGSNAVITGQTEPGALVWIEGERVDTDEQGGFNWMIKLRQEGKNKIHFLAQDPAGNETRRLGYAQVDAY